MTRYNVIMRGPIGCNNIFVYIKNFRYIFIDNSGYSAMPLGAARTMCDSMIKGNTVSMLVCAMTVSAMFARIALTDFEIVSVTPVKEAA